MYKHVLVPVAPHHGEVGARIIAVAKLLAGSDGRITLLTVLEPLPGYIVTEIPAELLTNSGAAASDQLLDLARSSGVDTSQLVTTSGPAAATILSEAERLGVDAIVLGSHRPNFGDYLLGSTAARVVRHAQCTVVVERSG